MDAAMRVGRRSCFIALGALTLSTAVSACANVPAALGDSKAEARANADGLFGSLTNRFTNVYRTPRYARARELVGKYALIPSEIYNDTSIWTVYGSDARTLFGDAEFSNGRYAFTNAPSSTPLAKAGDGRHIMRLRKLAVNDEYEWYTGVDFAAGTVTAADMHRTVNALLASAEGRSATELRTDARTAFPRTAEVLGRMLTIDTIVSVPDAQGASTVFLGIRITPDGIRKTYPKYAEYLDKYIKRLKFRFTLLDKSNVTWFDAAGKDGYITLRMRSKDGHFAPFVGAPRPMPDTLTLRVDLTAKIKLFTVGVTKLTGEWVNVNTEHERAWRMRFTKEPDWELPPIVGHLIRTPLRRPFEGDGTFFQIGFRDAPGQQTLLTRRASLTVHESAILRFLGKLGGTALSDFVSEAEAEENKFNAAVFGAMRADVAALLR